jgi:hypothetical protein
MTDSFVLTYDNLTATVLQYLERQDPATVAQIPTFISMCEFEVATQIKTLGQLSVAQTNLTSGNPVLQKPARWRKTVSMNLVDATGNRTPILLRKYEYLKNYWPNATLTGTPIYYGDYDYDHWLVAPTPDSTYSLETLYYERLSPLSSSNQTNWLTQNAPNVMLYGTLLQAMPFLKNDQRQIFEQKYQEAINALKNEDLVRTGDRQAIAQDS